MSALYYFFAVVQVTVKNVEGKAQNGDSKMSKMTASFPVSTVFLRLVRVARLRIQLLKNWPVDRASKSRKTVPTCSNALWEIKCTRLLSSAILKVC